MKALPGVGAVIRFRFDDKGFNDMKVRELKPNKLVRWQCVDGAHEWVGTELSFDLKENNGCDHPPLRAARLEGAG